MKNLTPMNIPAAAKLLGRTETGTRKAIERRQLPHRRVGKKIVLFQEELIEFLDSQPGVRLEDLQERVG